MQSTSDQMPSDNVPPQTMPPPPPTIDQAKVVRNRVALIVSSVFAGLSAVLIGFSFYYKRTRTLGADFEKENFNYMFFGGLLILLASIAVIVLSSLQKL